MNLGDPLGSNRERLEHCEHTVGHHTTNGRYSEALHGTTPALQEGIPRGWEGEGEGERENIHSRCFILKTCKYMDEL